MVVSDFRIAVMLPENLVQRSTFKPSIILTLRPACGANDRHCSHESVGEEAFIRVWGEIPAKPITIF